MNFLFYFFLASFFTYRTVLIVVVVVDSLLFDRLIHCNKYILRDITVVPELAFWGEL